MNLSRGLKGLLAATLLGALVAVTTAPFPALAATETYRDEFNSGDFNGSDGTLGWPAPWIEVGESDGPDFGLVEVVSVSGCAASPCVRIQGGVVSGGQGLRRYADLSSASSATLSMRTVLTGISSLSLQVWVSTDGINWIQLGSIGSSGTYTYDLTGYLASQTHIRITSSTTPAPTAAFLVDDVTITLDLSAATTTTTSTTSTTSTTTASTTSTTTASTTSTTTASTTSTTTASTTSTTTASTASTASTTTTAAGSTDPSTLGGSSEVGGTESDDGEALIPGGDQTSNAVILGMLSTSGGTGEGLLAGACCPVASLIVSLAGAFFDLSARALGLPLLASALPLLWVASRTHRDEKLLEEELSERHGYDLTRSERGS